MIASGEALQGVFEVFGKRGVLVDRLGKDNGSRGVR